MALAPRRDLFSVPSRSIRAVSTWRWARASIPSRAAAISPLTPATARPTAFPPKASPPSRSSTASKVPVEAPDGTMARPLAPLDRNTSASTVGLPRESRTWRPTTVSMALTVWLLLLVLKKLQRPRGWGRLCARLGPLPQGVEGGQVEALQRGAGLGGQPLHGHESPAELGAGGPQRRLRVHPEVAGGVDHGEE